MLHPEPFQPDPLHLPAHNTASSAHLGEWKTPSIEFSAELSFWLEQLVPKHLSPNKRAIARQLVTRWVAESRFNQA